MSVKKVSLCIEDGDNTTIYDMLSCEISMEANKKIRFTGELVSVDSRNRTLWRDLIKDD